MLGVKRSLNKCVEYNEIYTNHPLLHMEGGEHQK